MIVLKKENKVFLLNDNSIRKKYIEITPETKISLQQINDHLFEFKVDKKKYKILFVHPPSDIKLLNKFLGGKNG